MGTAAINKKLNIEKTLPASGGFIFETGIETTMLTGKRVQMQQSRLGRSTDAAQVRPRRVVMNKNQWSPMVGSRRDAGCEPDRAPRITPIRRP
jgi:hypothetical protein